MKICMLTFNGTLFCATRNFCADFTMPNKISVLMVRSCASSNIIEEYCISNRSDMASRNSEPSVKNRIRVFFDVTSSNRTVYLKEIKKKN